VTPSQTGNALTGLIPGSYTVTTTDANGCKNVSTLVIGNNQSPRITLNSGGCAITNNTRIEVVNASAYINFTWSNNATTPVINGLGNGTYTVTATEPNGCTTSAFTTVNSPNLALAANVGNACQGATSSIDLSVTPANINTLSYLWSNRATTQDLNGVPAGVYTVIVTDNASQCFATAAYTMTEVVLTANTGTASTTVTSGTSTILTGQYSPSNASVLWRVYQTSTALSNTNTYTAAPTETTIYEFVVSDRGCSVSSNVTLTVRSGKAPQFPNFFTPDGDTTNDTFGPVFTSDIEIVEFRIFNRWGEMLHDSPNNWTGIWNSEMQARDSYVYRFIYRFKGKTENEKPVYGEVTLVR
jgi:gliding motility-associated-like protein